MKPIQHLNDLLNKAQQEKYPNIRPELLAPYKMKANSANSLTQCILKYIKIMGGHAERISTTGRMIDKSREVTNVLGHHYKIGGMSWIPGTGQKGSADISAIVRTASGVTIPWRIEVKWGKDKIRPDQITYSEQVKAAGGHYSIVKTFDDFYEQYQTLISQ